MHSIVDSICDAISRARQNVMDWLNVNRQASQIHIITNSHKKGNNLAAEFDSHCSYRTGIPFGLFFSLKICGKTVVASLFIVIVVHIAFDGLLSPAGYPIWQKWFCACETLLMLLVYNQYAMQIDISSRHDKCSEIQCKLINSHREDKKKINRIIANVSTWHDKHGTHKILHDFSKIVICWFCALSPQSQQFTYISISIM